MLDSAPRPASAATGNAAPAGPENLSDYTRDPRAIVEIMVRGGAWLAVAEPYGSAETAVDVAQQIVATGHDVNLVRIVGVQS